MQTNSFPFAVRFIGLSDSEADAIEAVFELDQDKGHAYFRLHDDSLQDPDLYMVNGADLRALAVLSDLRPSDLRPALLVGSSGLVLPYPCIDRPIRWDVLFTELDHLIEKRADALSRLQASDVVSVPERRRRDRLDIDLTDPEEYKNMRRGPLVGDVLIVDKTPVFCQYVGEMLARHNIKVEWASDEAKAIELCQQQNIAVVMINTSTPEVDPYSLCAAIKKNSATKKTVVIFLVGKPFIYDSARARTADSDGLLNKPLSVNHLLSVFRKFLPLVR